jgi:hypothetical protein
MKITESDLRKIIVSEIAALREETEGPPQVGKEKADTKGTLDISSIAKVLQVDPGKLKSAVAAAKAGKRSSGHNAILGDVFVKLMEASPEDTVKVMNMLKKVTSSESAGSGAQPGKPQKTA